MMVVQNASSPRQKAISKVLRSTGIFEFWNDYARSSAFAVKNVGEASEIIRKYMPEMLEHQEHHSNSQGVVIDFCLNFGIESPDENTIFFFTDGVVHFLCGQVRLRSRRPTNVQGYSILTTPRSGSTFLCDLLTSTDLLGTPTEHLKRWVLDYLEAADLKYLDFMQLVRRFAATSNGLFGTKLIVDDLFSFIPKFKAEVVEDLCKGSVFVLQRSDKAAQAFSNVRSDMLNIYHVYDREAARGASLMPFNPDPDVVLAKERWLWRQEADLLDFLSDAGIRPKMLNYESMVQSRRGAKAIVDEIARSCGLISPVSFSWPRLIRVGAFAHPSELSNYKTFRSKIELYSARSEPMLDLVVGAGWGDLESWGVRTVESVVTILVPDFEEFTYFELLVDLFGKLEYNVVIDGKSISLPERSVEFEQWRLIGYIDRRLDTQYITVELGSQHLALEEVIFYREKPGLMAGISSNSSILALRSDARLT